MRKTKLPAACAALLLGGQAALAAPGASCEDLWLERNVIYKNAGYCFKGERAISEFGNDGCRYDDEAAVPLSDRERSRIRAIEAEEYRNGCR